MNLNPSDAKRLADVLLDSAAGIEAGADQGGDAGEAGRLSPGPFGRYRITRLVGLGGMGEVYEAEQESPARRVAIKVVRPDLISAEALRRFEHETRILGRLPQHPGIAPIFEAGQVETGAGRTPFFAMEFVEGKPLTGFAVEGKLSVRARLELFLKVCEAVEHAHRKGVIHRDLKPGNILVDEGGRPRVMDFGVARATESDVRATTQQTEIGRLVGTLPYMSPEQVGGDADGLDTRSDVYSLGVVLYELLGGKLPYELKGEGRGRIPEAVRAIREAEPAPLSSVDRVFRGDLETIVGKALAKERGQRYQSVGELGADIRRYLDDEAIVARRPGRWYQFKKFARRNRGITVGLTAAALFLIAGAGTSMMFAYGERIAKKSAEAAAERALEREREATHQASIAKSVTDFIGEVLASPDPANKGREVRVLDVLDRWSERLHNSLEDQPESKGELLATLAATYVGLGQNQKAEECRREGLALFERATGSQSGRSLRAMNDLAVILVEQGKMDEAYPLYMRAIEGQRALGDEDEVLTASANIAALVADKGDSTRALELYTGLIPRYEAFFGPTAPKTLTLKHGYAITLMEAGRFVDAEPLLRAVLEARQKALGDAAPKVLDSLNALAACYRKEGKLADAEPIARQSLDAATRVLGESHPGTIGAWNTLASILEDEGKLDQALGAHQSALDGATRAYPPGHWAIGLFKSNCGRCLRMQGRFAEAEPLLLDGFSQLKTALGAENRRTRIAEQGLRTLYVTWDKPDDAAKYREYQPPGAPAQATGGR